MKQILSLFHRYKNYIQNLSWYLVAKGINVLLKLFVGIYVVRHLSPSDYGLFNYVLAIYMMADLLSSLGISNILIKEIVNSKVPSSTLLGNVIVIKFISTALLLFLICLICYVTKVDNYEFTLIFTANIGLVFSIFNPIINYFEAKVQAKYHVLPNVITCIIVGLIKLGFIVFELDLIYFVISIPLEYLMLNIGIIFNYYFISKQKLSFKTDFFLIKSLITQSYPIVLSHLASYLYFSMDKFMIKYFLSDYYLAMYAVGIKLSAEFYFIGFAASTTLFPSLINIKKERPYLYDKRLKETFTILCFLAVLIIMPMMLFAHSIIVFLFTEKYVDSIIINRVTLIGLIPVFMHNALKQHFIIEDKNNLIMYSSIVGCVANFVLNLIFIPKFGINGAAVASTISIYVSSILFYIIHKETRKLGRVLIQSMSPKSTYELLKSKLYLTNF